jgi:hypothetical protein
VKIFRRVDKLGQNMESHFATKFVSRRAGCLNFLLLASVLILAAASPARSASFTASLDRDTISLGESATLTLTFEGGSPKNVSAPSVAGLQINSSQNFSYSFSGGFGVSANSTISVTYSVTPQREGEFTIPAFTAEIDGRQLASVPLKLTVSKASAPSAADVNSGNEVAFLKFVFPRNKVYVGEPVVGELDLYLRDDVAGLDGFQLTGSPTDGFNSGKAVEQQNRRVQVGNRVYTVIPQAVPLTATRTGKLMIGPFTANTVVVLPSQSDGGDPFAQMGMRSPFFRGEKRQVTLASEPFNVEVLPLPEQNKPANFTGAIGNFTMNATAGPTTVTVGDPITVRVQISGRGALDAVVLPAQAAWQNFKTYPPTTKVENSDQFGFQGTKTFEQIISPQNADVHELPALTFSFFNPDDGQYHTLTQAAVPLTIKAAGTSPMPTLAATKTAAPENQTPQDILPIKENLGTLTPNKTPLVVQPAFLAAQSVPVLAFLAAFIWRKRTNNLANNPRLRRQRAVAQLVRDGLNDLKKFAAENKSDEFFALLFRLLQEQLGERLDCPASAITENVIEEHPALRGAAKATSDGLRELFQLCNQARYAPVRGTSELNSVVAKFEKAVGELQEVKA